MKVLFILDEYYPLKNANTICADNIIHELSESYDITILSFSHTTGESLVDNNIRSIYFSFDRNRKKNFYEKNWKLLHYPLRNRELALLYKKYIQLLIEREQYDAIVFVVNPLESLYSILKINLSRKIKIIIYELDSISDTIFRPEFLQPFLRIKSLIFERKCYKKAYAVLHMKCHQKYFEDEKYNEFRQKFITSDFPVLINKQNYIKTDSTTVRLLFSGSILKNIRNPLPVFDIMLETIKKRENLEFVFYSKGDYEKNLEEVCAKSNGAIIQKGFVDTFTLDSAIQKADVLVSIGNTFSSFAPSKVYEYLSWKKPIIHFYLIDDDPVLETFGQLDFVLFVDMRDRVEANSLKIMDFVDKINELSFDTHDLFIMNKPEYTAQLIKDLLDDEIK